MSAAARREEIQLRLQRLRETRERELAAFDAVAAAHPELSAPEIAEIAQRKAAAEVELSLQVGGVVVSVGDRVRVKDDIQVLHRADRGHFAADLLKQVYLGERGEVVQVMRSFQGKPAVELRFADGVTKVFFVECLALSHESSVSGVGASSRVAARHTESSERAHRSSSGETLSVQSSLPKAEAPPGWSHLCMPHRRPSAASIVVAASVPEALPPPPPPTVAAVRGSISRRAELTAPLVSSSTPASSAGSPAAESASRKATNEVRKRPPAVAQGTRTVVKRAAERGSSRRLHSEHSDACPKSASNGRAQLSSFSTTAVDSIVEEDLGLPMPVPSLMDASHRFGAATVSESALDLRPTPDSSLCDISVSVTTSAAVPSAAAGVESDEAIRSTSVQLPEAIATQEQPSPNLRAEVPAMTGQKSSGRDGSGTRFCWLAGLSEANSGLGGPLRIALQAQCTTMFAVFAAITRKLRWDKQNLTASRLFTDKGIEIKSADAVQGGMRLVATTGCAYRPDGLVSHFAALGDPRPTPINANRTVKSLASRPTTASANTAIGPSSASSNGASSTTASLVCASPLKKVGPTPKQSTSTTAPKRVPLATPVARKSIHIRVYENGVYDDNIYRTVTVRPTLRTLSALRAVITRELQWRDGKKVCLLFDVSGSEVTELDDLHDGDTLVASAGDRFSIPYPNTAIHREALKLSERLC